MNSESIIANSQAITKDFEWFSFVLDCRLKIYRNALAEYNDIFLIPLPEVNKNNSDYEMIVSHYRMTAAERIILLLALIPRIKPELLAPLFGNNFDGNSPIEFGGFRGAASNTILPTVQTAAFIIAGNKLDYITQLLQLFAKEHFFNIFNIIETKLSVEDDNLLNATIRISNNYYELLVNGQIYIPSPSEKFPARLLTTSLSWEKLVLPYATMQKVKQIKDWISYGSILMEDWGLRNMIKPGYRSLFYGPPGTGKTLTAALLGKATERNVYRIDLSMTVSKWIGETEKNLAQLFEQAESQNWILFFDEADALFNQRTKVQNSNDRSSNQQVAYLLQRMEDFSGVIIMASNLKQNIDEAFTRRIQNLIYFPYPDAEERLNLWENNFLHKYYQISEDISFQQLAEQYPLAGGSIINVLRYVCIQAIAGNSKVIKRSMIEEAIMEEMQKEGKIPTHNRT